MSEHAPLGDSSSPVCARCGCPESAHRLDDSTNVSPVDPAGKFRCVGYDGTCPCCGEGGYWINTHCDCPDFVEQAA